MTEASTSPDEREHTLPSGLKVTIRSHRVLRRADIHAVWAAGNRAEEGVGGAAQHDKLMELLVASCSDPERYPLPFAAGTPARPATQDSPAVDAIPGTLDLLDGADYTALYRLMGNGYRLVNGLSVVPDPDEYADPKAPTTASNGSAPDSEDTPSKPSPATTGTTSTTTSTSTEPADGAPQS